MEWVRPHPPPGVVKRLAHASGFRILLFRPSPFFAKLLLLLLERSVGLFQPGNLGDIFSVDQVGLRLLLLCRALTPVALLESAFRPASCHFRTIRRDGNNKHIFRIRTRAARIMYYRYRKLDGTTWYQVYIMVRNVNNWTWLYGTATGGFHREKKRWELTARNGYRRQKKRVDSTQRVFKGR